MTVCVKEFKHLARGVLYIAFVGALLLFYVTQFFGGVSEAIENAKNGPANGTSQVNSLVKPQPFQKSYGMKITEIPEIVMPNVMISLLLDMDANSFVTYPIMFYKEVRLSEEELGTLEAVIQRLTGSDSKTLLQQIDTWSEPQVDEEGALSIEGVDGATMIPIRSTYEEFKKEMQAIDTLLGGGSSYNPAGFSSFGRIEMTYEEAMEQYNMLVYEDKITGGYARLFCDYMGIAVSLFAVFIPVGFLMRDRKSSMQPLIYARSCSSFRLIGTRYLASLLAILLPVIVLGIRPAIQLTMYALSEGLPPAPFQFLGYTLAWVLPTAMVTCSVGFFFTTLTNTPIGIGVQFLWSFLSLAKHARGTLWGGPYGTALVIRHNIVGERDLIIDQMDELLQNRIGYTILALILLGFSMLFYELQRRGYLGKKPSFTKIFIRTKDTV